MNVYELEHVNVQKGVEKRRYFVYNIKSELVNKLTIEEVLMYKILERKQLADKIYYMVVDAPRVAKACLPGQFVIVKMDEIGERIPLTICDYDREAGTVTIVFQIGRACIGVFSNLFPKRQTRISLKKEKQCYF